jgi:hypothetical protein
MDDRIRERTLLDDIEARQNDVIKSLDELNERIEDVLRQELARKNAEAAAEVVAEAAADSVQVPGADSVQVPGFIDGSQQPQAQYDACPQA